MSDQVDTSINPSHEFRLAAAGGTCYGHARIQLGQNVDGRWMWAVSWQTGNQGAAYCLAPKWGNFADNMTASLDCAIEEIRGGVKGLNDVAALAIVRWLDETRHQQSELFA